ncbi:MAG: homoserine kinase [Nocardioides sp.]
MARFVDGPVVVSVPATSANLGPGFDSLGLALDLRDRLTGEVAGPGLAVEVAGEGADGVPLDETHLVVRAMRAAFDEMGEQPPGVRLRCDNSIPHARGLGSSSAAIVGGIALARALVAGGTLLLDDDAAFRLAARLEGHPDNVAPAWYGGLVICGLEQEWYAVPAAVDPRIDVVVFVPPEPLTTELARGLLPASVPHGDAAANAGRTALLVAALASAPEHLLAATRDYLHQDYRRTAMPASLDLVDTLRADAVAAVISGAGPTVLAFCAGCDATSLARRAPDGWESRRLEIDRAGVRVE